jgi:hypothetical protein
MQLSPMKISRNKEHIIKIDQFKGGTNTMVDEARLNPKFATQSTNLIQVQDGLWQTRWGTSYYGLEITGEETLDGACEFLDSETNIGELIAVGGTTGKIYTSTDGGSWTEIDDSVALTPGNNVNFIQIGGYLYIVNGVDYMVRYDGTALSSFTEVDEPTDLAGTLAGGLNTGNYTAYYQVTAVNEVGETGPSTTFSITHDIERAYWSETTSDGINLTWTAVDGAKRYNIYYSDEAGYEIFLASSPTNSFSDNGTYTPNDAIESPNDNTTTGPKFIEMELSGNRLWGTKDPDNPYRVWFSGTAQYLGAFSPFYGGGWVNLEAGGRNKPEKVVHYRTGKGDPISTVLCSSPEGLGSIWQIEMTSITVEDIGITVPVTYKVVGSIGTNSPRSVVKARDNIFFANKRGVFSLRNKEQMYNVLSTDEISQAIRPNYRSLDDMSDICAYFYDGKVFFSTTENSGEEITFIFDMERGNWNYKWTIGVKQFLEYTDSNGKSRFLGIPRTGNRLIEFSESFLGDFGGAFNQLYVSPLLPVDKDETVALKTKEFIAKMGKTRGQIYFEILGLLKDNSLVSIASKEISDIESFGSNTGVGTDLASTTLLSTTQSNIKYVSDAWAVYLLAYPSVFSQSTTKKSVKKRKKVYALQFKVSATNSESVFTLLSLQAKGRLLKQRTPSNWLN